MNERGDIHSRKTLRGTKSRALSIGISQFRLRCVGQGGLINCEI